MAQKTDRIAKQRDIIDRKHLADAVDDAVRECGRGGHRETVLALLQHALSEGRAEIGRRLKSQPTQGYRAATEQAFLIN
jgi:[protein-PII] uridylyltransferase